MAYMETAYIAAGLIYFGYIVSLSRRASALRKEAAELARETQSGRGSFSSAHVAG